MASREQNRRGERRDTVNQDDRLTARLLEDEHLMLDGMPAPSGPFRRFAATPDRLAEFDRGRATGDYDLHMRPSDPGVVYAGESVDGEAPTRGASPSRTIAVSELTRLTDRLVEARELLATAEERLRSQQLITELAAADAQAARRETSELQDRLVSARAIVFEAQRTTRAATERCAFVEGRADALEYALEQALTASFFSRRRMRRERAVAANV